MWICLNIFGYLLHRGTDLKFGFATLETPKTCVRPLEGFKLKHEIDFCTLLFLVKQIRYPIRYGSMPFFMFMMRFYAPKALSRSVKRNNASKLALSAQRWK